MFTVKLFELKFILASVLGVIGALVDDKIQGGYNITQIEQWPFIAYYAAPLTPDDERFCSGILVDTVTAITAGHCVLLDVTANPYRLLSLTQIKAYLVVGVADHTNDEDPFYQKRHIKQLFIHPKAEYNAGSPPFDDRYDIGATKWERKLFLNARIQLAPLIPERLNPNKVFNDIIEQGGQCEIAGWGELEVHWEDPGKEVERPAILQGLSTDIISKEKCCRTYYLSMYQHCMRNIGEPVSGHLCHVRRKLNTSMAVGDSGSPVYCSYKGKKYVVGINVAGIGARDPPPRGPYQVLVPAEIAIDAVIRLYIKNITAPGGMSKSEKVGAAPFLLIASLATFI